MTLEQLRARLREIMDRLRAIHTEAGENALTDDQANEFNSLDTERQSVTEQIAREEARARIMDSLRASGGVGGNSGQGGTIRTEPGSAQDGGAPNVNIVRTAEDVLNDRSTSGRVRQRQLTDAILRANEGLIEGAAPQRNLEVLLRRHGRQQWWLENLLARSTDVYGDAFSKMMQGRPELLTDPERAAIAEGTSAQGGYLVPTHLDPTMLLTNDGTSNVMRQYATIKTLVDGRTWHGVTTAGATASWDAELAEVSDDSPNDFGQPAITVYKPQAFIQASVEAFQDVAGLATDIMTLLADARDRLEGAAHMTGTGASNQPKGLFTAINASSTLQITSTTAATIGEVDLDAVVEALPVRWRSRARWVMAPKYAHAIKRLGTAVASTFSGDLTVPAADTILGYGTVYTDDAPTTQTTTALDQEIVFADLAQYYIVDKPGGTSIEYVPVLLGSNALPTGARGYWMHWRTGGDMPVLQGGRILVDKTSA